MSSYLLSQSAILGKKILSDLLCFFTCFFFSLTFTIIVPYVYTMIIIYVGRTMRMLACQAASRLTAISSGAALESVFRRAVLQVSTSTHTHTHTHTVI